ncbi:hypothetical protein ACIRBX_25970 [Kitasatospora sp. NPDC096147]|uniref:hypothetical protein n=1 Tax=Kitasatospora sp. NPDC096147 TaxID=3364093 RepID=UPI00380A564F
MSNAPRGGSGRRLDLTLPQQRGGRRRSGRPAAVRTTGQQGPEPVAAVTHERRAPAGPPSRPGGGGADLRAARLMRAFLAI